MNHHSEEAEIRALMQRLYDRWAAGDAEGYAALFAEDADYVAFDGGNQKGRAAIIAVHKPLFEKWLKGSRLVGHITSIRFLAPNVALIHSKGNTIMAGQSKPAPERESIQTLVAVKEDDAWRFTAFHNTRVRPITQSFRNVVAWRLADLFWKLLGKTETSQSEQR